MSDRSLPPLSVDETIRILDRLSGLSGSEPVVLIGGTALAIWRGADTPAVMALNEHVYDLALHDRRAQRLYLEQGIDVASAELDDPRLPEPHRVIRLPQRRQKLQSAR